MNRAAPVWAVSAAFGSVAAYLLLGETGLQGWGLGLLGGLCGFLGLVGVTWALGVSTKATHAKQSGRSSLFALFAMGLLFAKLGVLFGLGFVARSMPGQALTGFLCAVGLVYFAGVGAAIARR
jgi:hypothetical protein